MAKALAAELRSMLPAWPLSRLDPLAELPERVKAVVLEQDRLSERLIANVQFGIGVLLLVLFLIAPRPVDSGISMLQPVPIALGLYLGFCFIRLALVQRGRLPGWFVALSIVTDIALLLGLIWSFHLQYAQPPPFSLKAPAVVYLFVFIVLRALRFSPAYVLAAGGAAAIGWGLLTIAAISASDAAVVTRSFATYLNGNSILIGAEIEKIFALLLVTGLLAFGVRRAQTTLITAVREEAAGKEISRFLSRGVAETISRSGTLIGAGHVVERDAAIMMLDIRGFTRFAMHIPAAEVVKVLTSFHARVVPVIRQHNGVIDKFLGDGVMATFGAVMQTATPVADALRALDAVMAVAEIWENELIEMGLAEPLRVNGAVAAGPIVFATLGNEDRLEYTVIGEAANLAAKLEKQNKIEKSRALVPAHLAALAADQGYVSSRERPLRSDVAVAGVQGAMDLVVWA